MIDQPGLPGFDEPPPFVPDHVPDFHRKLTGYKLFLALFPEPTDATALSAVSTSLRGHHGLHGACLKPERLHVTLHAVARFGPEEPIPLALIHAATAASSAVSHPPIQIAFIQAGSFSNPGDHNPFVLRCDDQSARSIAALRGKLQIGLRRFGLHPQPSATPHLTALYDRRIVEMHAIAAVNWTALRFALVLSHRGVGHHQHIGVWPLNA